MNMNEKEGRVLEGGLNVTLTSRLLMQGKDILAFMINNTVTSRPPITLRLIFPASQCSSLIGKGGSKIKEIREVQVAGDLQPNSTERAVTISAITQCEKHICTVMLEIFAIPGQFAILPQDLTKLHQLVMQHSPLTPLGRETSSSPLIGCIIGRQGSKINEICQMSCAQIKIAGATDGSTVRNVTITVSPANISVVQYLISARWLNSASTPINLSLGFSQSTPSASGSSHFMAILAASPSAINSHTPPSIHYALPVSSLLGIKNNPSAGNAHSSHRCGPPAQPYALYRKDPTSSSMKQSERQKFAPN